MKSRTTQIAKEQKGFPIPCERNDDQVLSWITTDRFQRKGV